MTRTEDNRVIFAGTNEIYRYGKKAQERVQAAMVANEAGYYGIPVAGGKYWTLGTSNGKYGEFVKIGEYFFSVNSAGKAYAKAGTDKGDKFIEAMTAMLNNMKAQNAARAAHLEDDED